MPGIGKSWKERNEARRVLIALASSEAEAVAEGGCRRAASWAAAVDDDEVWVSGGRVSVIAEGKEGEEGRRSGGGGKGERQKKDRG